MLNRFFGYREKGSNLYRELVGGLTTFLAMSYIVFVNPFILKASGIPEAGVMEATCIAAGLTTLLMGVLANYPIGLAPGMGQNVFFAFTLCTPVVAGGFGLSWQEALAAVFIGGLVFVALAAWGFRSAVLNSIPRSLKGGIAAGIGLLIAFVGLRLGGVIVNDVNNLTALSFGRFATLPVEHIAATLTVIGLAATMILMAWRVRGGILLGILVTFAAALIWSHAIAAAPAAPQAASMPAAAAATQPAGPVFQIPVPSTWTSTPGHGLAQVAGQFVTGFAGLFTGHPIGSVISILFVLFFMDLFDTVGTLVGVAQRADLLAPDGSLPRGERALLSDAIGTCVGAALGTSTVTSYIESATGVSDGARTGLANMVTGLLFFVPLFFYPAVQMIGGGIPGTALNPVLAPALILVGSMMLGTIKNLDFADPTEYIPAFLTLIIMPLSGSISTGIMWGFISYAAVKLLGGKGRQCPLLVYIFATLFLANYILIPLLEGQAGQ